MSLSPEGCGGFNHALDEFLARKLLSHHLESTSLDVPKAKQRVDRILYLYFWVSLIGGLWLAFSLIPKAPDLAALCATGSLFSLALIAIALHLIQKIYDDFVALHRAGTAVIKSKRDSPSLQ